ncbi:MAG: hypothetical protein GY718_00040 [Lentisphaerae bacterium]|nr:hypothetical protein [Lentisphaerota bacterium]
MIKFKKAKMPICWHNEEKEVDAYVYKNLMVHKIPTDETKHVWTISHVQTGFCVGMDYPPFRIMKDAKEMVEELTKDDDWYVPTVRLGESVAFDDGRAKILINILKNAWEKLYGIKYVPNSLVEAYSDDAIPERMSRHTKCVLCGREQSRHALGQDKKGMYGWFGFCLDCFPHDESIKKEKGKMCRW